jgi:hypothetical protein
MLLSLLLERDDRQQHAESICAGYEGQGSQQQEQQRWNIDQLVRSVGGGSPHRRLDTFLVCSTRQLLGRMNHRPSIMICSAPEGRKVENSRAGHSGPIPFIAAPPSNLCG